MNQFAKKEGLKGESTSVVPIKRTEGSEKTLSAKSKVARKNTSPSRGSRTKKYTAPGKATRALSSIKVNKGKKFTRVETYLYIVANLNNTLLTLCNKTGGVLGVASGGTCKFKGTRKKTPYAATQAALQLAQQARRLGVGPVEIRVSGPGPGREPALRSLSAAGIKIETICDVTGVPFNGCRAPKRRRL